LEKATNLKAEFDNCTTEEKTEFIRSILPEFCNIFMENQEEFMQEMMPMCMKAMSEGKMNMDKMKSMFMNMMMR